MDRRQFDVWAPNVESVDLNVRRLDNPDVVGAEAVGAVGAASAMGDGASAERTIELVRCDDGWWTMPDSNNADSTNADLIIEDWTAADYGYVIGGSSGSHGCVLPDPRSRRQPAGVHGYSRTFDATRFPWTDRAWTGRQLAGGVIYELHVGTFTPEGTFDGAIAKLDHLVSIGVDFVELLPVNAFNGTHNWGYDGVLWYAVHEPYGGPGEYQRFVDACHAKGLGVIQDVVYNHLGPSGNYLPVFGPYLNESTRSTWGSSLNLDGENSAGVRRYIIDNALMWLRDYHVDGLRLDAVHALRDGSNTHLLKQLAIEVDGLSAFVGRPLSLIAESDLNDPVMITPRECAGYGLTAQWSDDFHHAVHAALTRETTGYYADFDSLAALAKVIASGFFHDGTYSSFRGKFHGKLIDTTNTPAWRLVVSNQNHDQIGNRASGDRLTATLTTGQLAIAAVLTLLGPFTPMLFMGEEWAASTPWQFFTSHPEPELGEATAAGRVAEFARMGWDDADVPDPQDAETFARSRLDWSEAVFSDGSGSRHLRILELYRRLAVMRREHPEFTDPRFDQVSVRFNETARWMVIHRGRLGILVNFADETLDTASTGVTIGTVLLATQQVLDDDHSATTSIPAHSASIFRQSPATRKRSIDD
jgi:maltooligosyltrehalose trehalohydrolase